MDYMKNMKRPYLNDLKGNHRNVYDEVKDYRDTKIDLTELDRANAENQSYENHKFHINNAFFLPNVEPMSHEK